MLLSVEKPLGGIRLSRWFCSDPAPAPGRQPKTLRESPELRAYRLTRHNPTCHHHRERNAQRRPKYFSAGSFFLPIGVGVPIRSRALGSIPKLVARARICVSLAALKHRFGNEGDFGRPERFSESFAIDPVQVE